MSEETKSPTTDVPVDSPLAASPTLAKIPRTFEAVQAEYMRTVTELGQLTWQLEISKAQQQALYEKLNALGQEAAALPKPPPAAPAPKKLAAVPTPPKAGSDGTA